MAKQMTKINSDVFIQRVREALPGPNTIIDIAEVRRKLNELEVQCTTPELLSALSELIHQGSISLEVIQENTDGSKSIIVLKANTVSP